jgi:hypothetical protein
VPGSVATPVPGLGRDERRWLHDKYERLAAEEGQLSSLRTSYYAAIGTVLLTALVVAVADLLGEPPILLIVATFLALLGILISIVWTVLLHRTNDAQRMWREAALRLELAAPPLEGEFRAPITLRSGRTIQLDLYRPFLAHDERFADTRGISWLDRVNPNSLTEVLPMTFLGLWATVLGLVWIWYFLLR